MATDVLVIGGGVVGCSVVFELTNLGYSCLLLEKNEDLVSGASSGNSGILHRGFDAPANSLELHCIKLCQQRIFPILDKLGIKYKRVGATMVAWNETQAEKLPHILQTSRNQGVPDVFTMTTSELYQKEPYLRSDATGALWIPGETVFDPWLAPVLFAHHSRMRGSKIITGCQVTACNRDSFGQWSVNSTRGTFRSTAIINCAGLWGDKVDSMGGYNTFSIKPRKGQFIVYGQPTKKLIQSNILPVPTEISKGIIVFKTVYDSVIVGPTAENVNSREIPGSDPAIRHKLLQFSHMTVPSLAHHNIIGEYVGVRPATETKNYHIHAYEDRNWITVGGIRSTGVSACLGIASYVGHLVKDQLGLEPSRGGSNSIQRVNWQVQPGKGLVIDGYEYLMTHPITKFGTMRSSHL